MSELPKHVVIIMDGNGRWAKKRKQPRIMGHKAGAKSVRAIITACAKKEISALTLFAFSTENWQRSPKEVNFLMDTFFHSLSKEAPTLAKNNVKFRVIGNIIELDPKLQKAIAKVEKLTVQNTGLNLAIAINYSGRWDIWQAAKKLAEAAANQEIQVSAMDLSMLQERLCLADLPEPDLFIRTGGELRISNFMLWQLAYTELYFTEVLWPDFSVEEFDKALLAYSQRQRRFGKA